MRISDWSSDVCSSDLYQTTRLKAIEADQFLRNTAALDHLGISVQHVQHVSWLESSALADFKGVEVVTRRALHRARTKFRIGMLVGHDGDKASGNRQATLLANKRWISRLFRSARYGHHAPHGFRP